MWKIFLSHSHADASLAHELREQIHKELEIPLEEIFNTSDPDTIPSGDWNAQLMAALTSTEVFIPLITPSSEKSVWVAFEYGSFRERREEKYICALHHPKADISTSPINTLISKEVTDKNHLKVFFENLCGCFHRDFSGKANLDAIIEKAVKTPTITTSERQLQVICKLHLITASNSVVKNAILKWMHDEDILHDAQLDWIGDLGGVTFTQSNMQRINLGGNNLHGASFRGSNLENAILGSTKLQGADFQLVTSLQGASFQRAELDETTTLPDGEKYKPELGLEQLTKWGAVIDR